MHPLIDVPTLRRTMESARICDLRWDFVDKSKGRTDYEAGHIPGAVFVDLDTDLAGPPGDNGRHPLPAIDSFTDTLERLGIDADTHVVAYDDDGGRIAARLWWMLRSIGHERAQVLDGGLGAWLETGHQLEGGSRKVARTHYRAPTGFGGVGTMDALAGRAIVDVRAAERYRGEVEPIDPKAGHIPGAINIPTIATLDERGRFLGPGALAALYEALPPDPVVSCGSGVTACHAALAMVVAGRSMPDVYVGSFSEWSRHQMPVTTGERP